MRRSDEQRPADSDGDERKYSGVPHGDNSPPSARQSRMHSSQAGGMQKIVEQFKAVEEVPDRGQFRISCRFVLWYKKHFDNTMQIRARLVDRG